MTPTLTKKQTEVLATIRRLYARDKVMPTLQEIANDMNLSKTTVYMHVRLLIKKNRLRHGAKGSTDWKLVSERVSKCPKCGYQK